MGGHSYFMARCCGAHDGGGCSANSLKPRCIQSHACSVVHLHIAEELHIRVAHGFISLGVGGERPVALHIFLLGRSVALASCSEAEHWLQYPLLAFTVMGVSTRGLTT